MAVESGGTWPASKVAAITLPFWIMKILATTLGETAGDFISMTLGLGYYVGLGITFAALVVILYFQISSRFHPLLFWTAIIATTTAGTEISDFMDRSLGLGYFGGSLILTAGLVSALAIWYARNRSLSVYPIVRRDEELLFWLAVLFSNSLGTAFGDFLVDVVGLSFIQGALVTAGVIGVVAGAHYLGRANDVLLFWIAFVFTRPFGATFGDLLTKPVAIGGLNLPRETASLITLALLLAVLYASTRGWRDRPRVTPVPESLAGRPPA
ncbi:COG4705 family protein [Hyphomicrobium sp.]|uniref:COG4705 family protein n=1 Tax=Hyphomicrobium sp. TaxID=82 RepID=UPI003F6F43AD